MTRILLVRHGQSTWNAEGRWQGQADPPLSERGERQAHTAVVGLTALPAFDLVVASPLRRALRTAELLAAGAGLARPYPVLGLAERAAGAWEGLTHAEIDTRHPGARQGSWRPEGYEHDEELRVRARAALRPFEEARVLAVTHEGLIRALDGDPDPLPNLAARWVVVEGDAIRPEGERISLRT